MKKSIALSVFLILIFGMLIVMHTDHDSKFRVSAYLLAFGVGALGLGYDFSNCKRT